LTPGHSESRCFAAWAAALVALTSFLPFVRGILTGQCFYFRDLSRQFFPLRRFAVEGLRRGELRFWNPYLHEGVPLSLPALSYPVDLLQALIPNESGFSLLLALHVPLGGLFFLLLGRGLGLSVLAAAGGAIVYALGGFYLSTLNLYVYLQAAAWAPLVVLGLLRSGEGRPRWQAGAAVLVAVALSTTGAEIVAQAVAVGLVLAFAPREPRRLLRIGASLALGAGLAAPTLAIVSSLVAGSARAGGFPTDVVLAQSIDPWTLGQLVIGNWHGNLADLANQWWGSRFFPSGFPYVVSLYLGAVALTLAGVGALGARAPRGRLLALVAGALVMALGRFAGLAPIVDAMPFIHAFRHPSKAFFTVHLGVALLAALGLDRMRDGRGWRAAAAIGLALGGLLASLPALPSLFPGTARWFLAGFLPPSFTWPQRVAVSDLILSDAARGGVLAVLLALVALLVMARRLDPGRAAGAAVVLVAVDLIRTGAGLNPMVTPDFYRLSPEMETLAASLRESGGRVFSCDPESSPAYFRARSVQPEGHDAWTFAVFAESLTPAFNMNARLPSALSRDLTMLVPAERTLAPEDVGPAALASGASRLRAAGVAHVVCLESLTDPSLSWRATFTPRRIAPVSVSVYDLERPLPLRELARHVRTVADRAAALEIAGAPGFQVGGGVAVEGPATTADDASGSLWVVEDTPGRIQIQAETNKASVVVIRDAFAPGWHASVNGAPAPVWRADGRHRAIPIPAGSSRVRAQYDPPGFSAALAVAALAAAATGLLARRPRAFMAPQS
jgi:hypothetical protein